MPAPTLIFLSLALLSIATAAAMLLNRNAVYAALFLILNFSTVALLYLLLGAPFIAMAQVTVYPRKWEEIPADERLRMTSSTTVCSV